MRWKPYEMSEEVANQPSEDELWMKTQVFAASTFDEDYQVLDVEEEEQKNEEMEDEWKIDAQRRVLIRVHREARNRAFKPHNKTCPIPLKMLTSQRRTMKTFEDGSRIKQKGLEGSPRRRG